KAGALSLALLLASRLLGLLRESAQAAAFGASGLADVVVLMLTLPDWVAGFLASGALAYVLVPAWAGHDRASVAATQRRVALWLVGGGVLLGLGLLMFRHAAVGWLAAGLPAAQLPAASSALVWSAIALPAALLASLWATRLQHERDFTGMYGANLVVNAVLIAAIALAAYPTVNAVVNAPANLATTPDSGKVVAFLGIGLLAAMLLRLAWLHWRTPASLRVAAANPGASALPAPPVWLWAALSAGLPLALPFVARSIASRDGEGALATFNYAWKLVELPLILAIQLVATLAFPAIARAAAQRDEALAATAVRNAFALAWTLACAAAAGLVVGAPAIASLLFGWGRMDAQALERIAQWGSTGAWGLLPQAVIAVALTVLAARASMSAAVWAYAVAVAGLLLAPAVGWVGGAQLMVVMNVLLAGVAFVCLAAMGREILPGLPWKAMAIALACLLGVAAISHMLGAAPSMLVGLAGALLAATLVVGVTWWSSADLRAALAR
ncbi:MAG: lipid II flippase MurJ, partial [Pseudomonadota bacterium]